MSATEQIINGLMNVVSQKDKKVTTPYDTAGTVTRVEGDTVWVHFVGGVDETPVQRTIAAEAGDTVQVRVGNGSAWLIGNQSAPPTDDKAARAAHAAADVAALDAYNAQLAADAAQRAADRAAANMATAIVQLNSDIADLQSQIDGNVTSWFFDYDPTLANLPASEWIAEGTEAIHLGDTFYNTDNGYAYRWMSDGATPPTYSWQRIADTDVTQALAMAAAAQDTADSKRRVFVTTPTPPYDVGDLWFAGGSGDILTCLTAKAEGGSYAATDWSKMNKYTDDTRADQAWDYANTAKGAADAAQLSANAAATAASNAQTSADNAATAASNAQDSADEAQASADSAGEYAVRALGNLSTVQSVVETLNWITQHGTMTLTSDTAIDPTHVYFVQDAGGDYVVGSTHYSLVREPVAADLSTYYELSIDESLQNYVGTHLAVTDEGLWVLPASTGYKVLIATGNGTQYTTAGTYIIDAVGNMVALFGSEETLITSDGLPVFSIKTSDNSEAVNVRKDYYRGFYYIDPNRVVSNQFTVDLSKITSTSDLLLRFRTKVDESGGYFSVWIAQGGRTVKTVDAMSFDIRHSTLLGKDYITVAASTSDTSHGDHYYEWMFESVAYTAYTSAPSMSFGTRVDSNTGNGAYSFTIGEGLISGTKNQLVVGRYNKEDTGDVCLFIVGNGQADDNRSDAFRIDFDGEFKIACDTNPYQYTYDYDLYNAITALGWESEVIE